MLGTLISERFATAIRLGDIGFGGDRVKCEYVPKNID
jgi:hypothetical protein